MHPQTMSAMSHFMLSFMSPKEKYDILDVGSFDVNGAYRPLFVQEGWKYVGLDQCAGKNVDLVVKDPYVWPEVQDASYDVIISGQMFEHCPQFWRVAAEIKRVLKPGGYLCIIVPAALGHEHRYPVDCYRFLPDGLRAIADYIGFRTLVADWVSHWKPEIDAGYWRDTILVARKPFE